MSSRDTPCFAIAACQNTPWEHGGVVKEPVYLFYYKVLKKRNSKTSLYKLKVGEELPVARLTIHHFRRFKFLPPGPFPCLLCPFKVCTLPSKKVVSTHWLSPEFVSSASRPWRETNKPVKDGLRVVDEPVQVNLQGARERVGDFAPPRTQQCIARVHIRVEWKPAE